MYKIVPASIIFLAIFFSNLHAQPVNIIEVLDGDTLLISRDNIQKPVAIFGIDAPELGQPQGKEAKEHLEKILLEYEIDFKDRRSYNNNQTSYEIHFRHTNGAIRNVGCDLIANGLAFYDRDISNEKAIRSYVGSEKYARERGLGVWQKKTSSETIVYPWIYRKMHNVRNEEDEYNDSVRLEQAEILHNSAVKRGNKVFYGSYLDCMSILSSPEDRDFPNVFCSLSSAEKVCVSESMGAIGLNLAMRKCSGN